MNRQTVFCKLLPLAAILAAGGTLLQAAGGDQILGTWSPDNGQSKIEINKCGALYCGNFIWMRLPHNDDKNSNPSLRSRPLSSARIMTDYKFEGGTTWGGGKLYDPNRGRSFPSKFVLVNHRTLEIQEGESKKPIIWKRVAE